MNQEVEAAEAAVDRALERVVIVQERAAKVAALGDGSDYEDGAVIEWTRTFERSVKVYTYVAVKIGGRWFITGTESQAWSWDMLVSSHLQYADAVWIMTASEQIA